MSKPKILLINPPLWNTYAPHLAIPLLAGSLKARGWDVRCLDLSIESVDWLVSRKGLLSLESLFEKRYRDSDSNLLPELERARLIYPETIKNIDNAKQTLRSFSGLQNHEEFLKAKITLRNALHFISASFPGLKFDLFANDLYYSARSSQAVLKAADDPEKNIYRWLFQKMLPPHLEDPNLGLVGISVSADTQLVAAITIAKLIKEIRPDIHITMGGNYTTRIVHKWKEPHPLCQLIDSFILYEGEESLPKLCQSLFNGGVESIPGHVYKKGDKLHHTPPQDVQLDEVPFADFSDYPLEKYFAPGPVLPTYASRSCIFNCAFCSIPFASNRFRMRNPERIVDEMEYQKEKHGSRHFMFVDELLTLPTLQGVSDELIKRDSKLFWYGETRFAPGLNEKISNRLYQSGCRRMNFGLESFNQRILDLMNKETRVDYIPKNLHAFLESGIPVHLFVILGFPGENKQETTRTIFFAEEIMRKSDEQYGVPYSTWGASPFVLDLNSPIGLNPDKFGIEIIPPKDDEDLALSTNYITREGISETETSELMEATARRSPYRPRRDANWFHRSSSREVEEEMFLRACYDTGLPKPLTCKPKLFIESIDNQYTWLEDDVTVLQSNYSFVDQKPKKCTLLYKSNRDYLVEIPGSLYKWEHWLKNPTPFKEQRDILAKTLKWTKRQSQELLEMLLRFELLICNKIPVSVEDIDSEELIFYQEKGVYEEFIEEEQQAILISTITGKSVTMNLEAYALWSLCSEGFSLIQNDKLQFVGLDHLPLKEIKNVLFQLAESGFVYLKKSKRNR
ncbi:hypothetical protein CV945_16005 [Geobacillus sp. Manikaran-105]|uniref:B12-binding domain-containing radical SAM protein n=1 Tax=Geobacillus sp. Manikaran-105 TaxID=2055940 RepID=UPI000C293EFF|nr:radical SAM protein [Geobacillus sp. Manikaran-105]PJW13102.1 hypothetical protein CV945_16005 [Geobacillus sp. Manikaran-105]